MQGKEQEVVPEIAPEINEIFQLNRCKTQRMCDEIIARQGAVVPESGDGQARADGECGDKVRQNGK